MDTDQLCLPKRCSVCGARSNDLFTAWSNPKSTPCPYLLDWRVDWDDFTHNPIPNFDVGCVVCATVLSILVGTYKKPNYSYLRPQITSTTISMGECETIILDIEGQQSILINPLKNSLSNREYGSCYNFPTSKGPIEALNLAKRWLHSCKTSHEECALASEPYVPSRLLDVTSRNPKLLLRCEIPNDSPFVALSHCWGDSQPLKTVNSNVDSHRRGISLEALPETFKDAVKITKILGLRFLWIDSLCIVQDDKWDWEQESAQMEKIYGNADLVLAASAASSAHDGFLRDRPCTSLGRVSVRVDSKSAPVDSIYRIAFDHINHRDEPLDCRAWAFQERLMARRYLSYGTDEMTWNCRKHSLCECGWNSSQPSHFNKLNLEQMLGLLSHWGLTTLWINNIVIPYTRRRLTVQSDKLVALSAVASRFQSYYGGSYLAGLWEEDLIYGLLWKTRSGKPEEFEAPSWSWVSVNSDCFSYNMWAKYSTALAKVGRTSVKLSTKNIYGPVSGGSVQLRGRAVQAKLCIGDAPNNWNGPLRRACKICGTQWAIDCWLDMPLAPYGSILNDITERADVSARRIYFVEKDVIPKAPATYSIWILLMAVKDMFGEYNGLILGPSPKQPGCFERLGLASWPWGGLPCKWVAEHKVRRFIVV
ncbi:HET-domain-containing protein [Daldinia loculata]|nr:HET-domain-containing protein [Daldinia loculata]